MKWSDISKKFDTLYRHEEEPQGDTIPKVKITYVYSKDPTREEILTFLHSTLDEYVRSLIGEDERVGLPVTQTQEQNNYDKKQRNKLRQELLKQHELSMADDYTKEERNGNIYEHKKEKKE